MSLEDRGLKFWNLVLYKLKVKQIVQAKYAYSNITAYGVFLEVWYFPS